MKTRFFRAFLPASISLALLGSPAAQAATYYWDNLAGAGFGTAGGTWSATTAGPIPGWNTDVTGTTTPASVTTATTDIINFGTGTIGQDLATGSITVGTVNAGNINFGSQSGTITLTGGTITLAAAETITVNNATDTINSILAGAATSFTKAGTGILNLGGINTYAGATTVSAGTLNLTGNRTVTAGNITVTTGGTLGISNGTFSMGQFQVGVTSGTSTVNQTGGSVTMNGVGLLLGNGAVTGIYNLSGGTLKTVATAGRGVMLGVNGGETSTFNLSGTGILNVVATSNLQIGRSDAVASSSTDLFSQTGGTATIAGTLSLGGAVGGSTGVGSTLTVTGGTFSATAFTLLAAGNTNTAVINIGNGIASTAVVTLPNLPTVRGTSSTATLNLDGGTLKNSATGTFITGLTNAFIKAGGANFDTGLNSTTISQNLLTDLSSFGGGLTKQGINTLTLSGSNTYTGATTISAGTLSVGATGNLGAAASNLVFDGGTLQITGTTLTSFSGIGHTVSFNAGKTVGLDINSAANTFTADQVLNQTTGGLIKAGAGTLILNQANTYTGNTTVTGGILNITGGLTGNNTTSTLALGTTAANTVTNISSNVSLFQVTGAAIANSNAVYNQTAGTVVAASTTTNFGVASAGYGYFNLIGGSYTGQMLIASGTGTGVAYVGGGGILNINTAAANGGIAFAGTGALTAGPSGTVTRNGTGAFYLTAFTGGTGILNVAGGNVDLGTGLIRAGNGASQTGQTEFVNLAGGTLTMGTTVSNLGAAGNLYVNFAGGTLKASAALNSPFATGSGITTLSTIFGAITNNNNANTAFNTQIGTTSNFTGGLTVDTNNNDVTYGNALLGATGNGVTQSNITVTGGSGYIGAPLVTFTGGTLATNGTPASGYAVISAGAVTGIVITSPGEYTVDPTVTLTGGGGTLASVALTALTANVADTGLTKIMLGTLTLTATNTYAGATQVTGGTLALSGTGAINSTSGITISGSGAKFVQTSSTPSTPAITLTQGTLDGTTSVGDVTVGAGTGGIVANGNGVSNTILTLNSLNFTGAGAASLRLAGDVTTATPGLTVTNALTTSGTVSVNLTPTAFFNNGNTYNLIGYGSFSGSNANFALGGSTGLTGRQSGTFGNTGATNGFITLAVSGDLPVWTGLNGGQWIQYAVNTPTSGTPAFALETAHTTTDFWIGDVVKFNDTYDLGAGAVAVTGTTVTIQGGNVSPTAVAFNNSAVDYIVTSSDGSGIATGSLTKNGSGTVTINNTNSYTGGTNITAGTLVLGNATDTLANTGAVTVDGATSILSIGANSDTVGAVSLKNGASITGSGGTLTGSSYAVESGSISAILGGGALTKTTGGTVILSGANTYTGATTITGGSLQMSGVGSIANSSSVLVGSGSTLDLNGTNQTITLGASAGTIANNSGAGTSVLTFNGSANGGSPLIVDSTANPGGNVAVVVTASSQNFNALNTYSGGTTVNGGAFLYIATGAGAGTGAINLIASNSGLVTNGSTIANDINGPGYISNNVNAAATITLSGTLNTSGIVTFRTAGNIYNFSGSGISTLSGSIGTLGGTNGLSSGGSIIKSGSGTLTLSGANIYTGSTTVQAGTLILSGARTAASGSITVGNLAGNTGTLKIQSGTHALGANSFVVGNGDTAVGVVNQSGGAVSFTGGNQLLIGNGGNSTGTYSLSGGTLTTAAGAGIRLGVNTGTGNPTSTFNLSDTGTLAAGLSSVQIGRSDSATVSNTINFFNQTGGTATIGTLTMGGGAANAATAANIQSTLDLSGGTFAANAFTSLSAGNANTSTIIIRDTAIVTVGNLPTVRGIGSTATLNFDGGTLMNSATGTFITGLTNAFIKAGGATFDTSLNSTIISQDLLTDTTSFGGGLTKAGVNTLTLTGVNTYTGATAINAGKLVVNGDQTLATGATTVAAGTSTGATVATLAGNGTIGGSVSLTAESASGFKNGGVLAPTASADGIALKVAGATHFGTGSIFEWNLVTADGTDPGVGTSNYGSYGQVAGTGDLTGVGAVFKVVLSGNTFASNFWDTNKSWNNVFGGMGARPALDTLFTSFDTSSGLSSDGTAAGRGQFTFNGSTSTLTWSAVPEPTSALVGLLVGAGLLRRRRSA